MSLSVKIREQLIASFHADLNEYVQLPLSTITGTFGRMARDLAKDAGKEAVLEIIGGETELDKRALEQIKDPLIHLLRNAVDHGLERPKVREAAGKPCVGTVTLTAEQLGKDVTVSVSDDGAGLDLEAIRSTVARRGWTDTGSLSEGELLSDVLELPVSRIQRASARVPAVVLASAGRRMAFAVDELAGKQEVVVKSLGKQLSRVGGVAGATVMGSGEVVLILNVGDLIKLAAHGERRLVSDTLTETASPIAARAQRRILVVDDSITTRTLEKNILEAAGYKVELATDGEEALGVIASSGVPNLIVSDVAMPRMDGFELTQRIKNDGFASEVPVILVTSLDSPEDKARGIEVGADAYIIKSGFDQNNLLETIEQSI